MTVYKDEKRGTWYFTADVARPGEKRHQVKRRGFRTKSEAKAAERALLAQADELRGFARRSTDTVGAFLTDWHDRKKRAGSYKASTLQANESRIRNLIAPRIGEIPLGRLQPEDLDGLYLALLEAGKSPTTVVHVHRLIHRALEDAVRWRKLNSNPARHVSDKPSPASAEMTVWTAEQVRAFLDHVRGDRLEALWIVAATTGMRRGEIVGLRWSDVDLEAGRLSVQRSATTAGYQVVVSSPKSDKSRRSITLDPATVAALRSHRRRQAEDRMLMGPGWQDSDGYVFTLPDGTLIHPQTVTYQFQKAAKAAGLPVIRLHDLRHGWATMALRAQVHPLVVKERLGHSDIRITLQTYSHVAEELHEEAAARVAGAIFGGL